MRLKWRAWDLRFTDLEFKSSGIVFFTSLTLDVTILSFCIVEQHSLHPNTHASTLGCNHDTADPYSDAMSSSFCHSRPVSHSTLDVDDAQ